MIPETYTECKNTDCKKCNHYNDKLQTSELFGIDFCVHRNILKIFTK